jgi:hypothetical protein
MEALRGIALTAGAEEIADGVRGVDREERPVRIAAEHRFHRVLRSAAVGA